MNKKYLIEVAQAFLMSINLYNDEIDGIIGKNTINAMNGYLKDQYEFKDLFRRSVAVIQCASMDFGYKEIGIIDGFYGPRTEFGVEWVVASLKGESVDMFRETEKTVTKKHLKKLPTYSQLEDVYGKAGTNIITVELPYKLRIAWNPELKVQRTQANKNIAEDLQMIFELTGKEYDQSSREELGIDLFGGCYNYRKMRGASKLSTHAFGIAIDIDPSNNGLRTKWKDAKLSSPEHEKFINIITEKVGWMSLGKEKNYDSMHFQKSR